MTRLRDDGYLETDDPVVAACFLRQQVRFKVDHTDNLVELMAVSDDRIDVYPPAGLAIDERNYPILIPAATVAVVVGYYVETNTGLGYLVVASAVGKTVLDGVGMVADWLRKHTEESE